jgi:O-antigen/teichoic acid export membrane protein
MTPAQAVRAPKVLAIIEAGLLAVANFLIFITLVRSMAPDAAAGYGTALSAAFACQVLMRVGLVTPSAIWTRERFVRRSAMLCGAHVVMLCGLALASVACLVLVAVQTGGLLWWAAAKAVPALFLLVVSAEFERVMLIKLGLHARLAMLGSAAAAGVLVLCAGVYGGLIDYGLFMSGLALTGALKLAVAIGSVTVPSWLAGLRALRMGVPRFAVPAFAQFFGAGACSNAPVFALAALSTPTATAAFAAMRTLYQPMQIIVRSLEVVDRTRFHAVHAASKTTGRAFGLAIARQAAVTGAVILPILLAGPWLLHAVYGGRFDAHLPTFILWAGIMVLINLVSITDTFVTHIQALGRYTYGQLAGGALVTCLAFVMVPSGADAAAALAAIAGWSVILAAGAILVLRHKGHQRRLP